MAEISSSRIVITVLGKNRPGIVAGVTRVLGEANVDIRDITQFPLHYRVDCIAASFIRKASDIDEIRRVLGPQLQHIQIIAKIENQEGLQNYESIVEKVDGLMVARGDLGLEMAPEKVFLAQKYMLHEAALRGRFTITATQMLDSMIRKPR